MTQATEIETVKVVTLAERLKGELTEFSKADVAIEELKERYGELTILSLDDKDVCKAVVAAHVEVKKYRVAIDKKRKEIKAPAIKFGRDVEAEAKRLTALIRPLEEKLDAEREKLRAEERRIKEEEDRKAAELLQTRIDAHHAVGAEINAEALAEMSDDMFAVKLEMATNLHDRTKRAEGVRDQLAVFGKTVLVSELIDLSESEQRAMLDTAKTEHEAEQERLKLAEQLRIENEKRDREALKKALKENEEKQAEIDRLKTEQAPVAPDSETEASNTEFAIEDSPDCECCDSWLEATDVNNQTEVFDADIVERDGRYFIGLMKQSVSFCPWCGSSKDN